MKIECPRCKALYELGEEYLGKHVSCSVCEQEFLLQISVIPVTAAAPQGTGRRVLPKLLLSFTGILFWCGTVFLVCNAKHLDNLKYAAELARRNRISMEQHAAENQEKSDRQMALFETIDNFQTQNRLTYVNRFELAQCVKKLGIDGENAGFKIDRSTGKIIDYDEVYPKFLQILKERRLADLNRTMTALTEEKNAHVELRDAAGVRFSDTAFRPLLIGSFLAGLCLLLLPWRKWKKR